MAGKRGQQGEDPPAPQPGSSSPSEPPRPASKVARHAPLERTFTESLPLISDIISAANGSEPPPLPTSAVAAAAPFDETSNKDRVLSSAAQNVTEQRKLKGQPTLATFNSSEMTELLDIVHRAEENGEIGGDAKGGSRAPLQRAPSLGLDALTSAAQFAGAVSSKAAAAENGAAENPESAAASAVISTALAGVRFQAQAPAATFAPPQRAATFLPGADDSDAALEAVAKPGEMEKARNDPAFKRRLQNRLASTRFRKKAMDTKAAAKEMQEELDRLTTQNQQLQQQVSVAEAKGKEQALQWVLENFTVQRKPGKSLAAVNAVEWANGSGVSSAEAAALDAAKLDPPPP